jgi:lipoate---protein ligase
MIFVDNENVTDPAVNLALEEYLMRNIRLEEDILLFYINEPSIIIGRNQNTLEEINLPYVEAHGIHVVRRLSGGGAVYHDLGNLNFSFISQNKRENVHNFVKFTEPVIQVLQKMGARAELSGRNDILVEGRKISGNAQYITAKRMVSHGTLLFNSDLSRVAEALNVKMSKIESKGIKSVRSRVANITEYLPQSMDILEFRSRLLRGIFDGVDEIPQYRLTDADWQAVRALSEERYKCWDWNFGQSPEFNVRRTQRFASGEIDAHIDVQHGAIRSIQFYGDFFGREDVKILADQLTGRNYTAVDLDAALAGVEISNYIHGISKEEFVHFLYG